VRRKNTKFIDPRYFMDEKMELNESNPMEVLGVHSISDPTVLIQAVSDLLAKRGVNNDNRNAIISWLTSSDRKEKDRAIKDELKNLRDEVVSATPDMGGVTPSYREKGGYTDYQRAREKRHGARYPQDVPEE
jgi:hypothetical protein